MSELQNALQKGFKTASDFNTYKFDNNFKGFKHHIRFNHETWEDISEEDVQRLFIYEMFGQGYIPKELDVADYIDDDGVAPAVNYFSNSELEKLQAIEALGEDEFFFQRNLGISTIMKLLKDTK